MAQFNSLIADELGKKYLSFHLGAKDTAGIPVESIIETAPISVSDILPVPEMPGWILGIYNWRGEMLWMVSLEGLLGYQGQNSVIDSTLNPMILVIQTEEKSLGLLIGDVIDIEGIDPSQQRRPTPELFNQEMIPFIEGYTINEAEEILIQLNPQTIIDSSRLAAKA